MAEVVVNIVVDQLISATTEWVADEISLIYGVEYELNNMYAKMQTIQKVMDDAENKSMKEDNIKQKLEKLQDISYDMEDVMDEWNTRVQKQKLEDGEENINASNEMSRSTSTSNFTCLSYKQFNCFSNAIKQVGWRRDIAMRIRAINQRMNMIFLEIEKLDLISSKVMGNNVINEAINTIDRTTTSSIEESQVHGRDVDKKYLLGKVLLQSSDEQNITHVIPIVGAGGLGKTTLAQLLYNDDKVKHKFDNRIWVCVSNPFDEVKVAHGILEGINVDHERKTHLQTLHESIKDSLSGKKILLVLDDVWEEDSKKWKRLQHCLKFGAKESRVIVTTRSEEVAKIMSSTSTNIFKPTAISSLHCWLLIRQEAFQGKRKEKYYTELAEIGKKIAKKCKGLPLVAKVLGGLLRAKDTLEEWNQVLTSEIWDLEKVEIELFPQLFLSYKELSPSLKRCFSFCALFPKDYSFDQEQLISFWMAHIHLDSRTIKDNMMLRVTGQRYIKFLKSGAFLEEEHLHRFDGVKMHDIMHDFALHLSGHEFLSLDKAENNEINMKARHLFARQAMNLTSFCDVGKLRTCYFDHITENVTLDLFKQLRFVRALYLSYCGLEEVPQEIGNLIHLRTLDLSYNRTLRGLPETIGELYNLQYLFLEGIELLNNASLLPKSIGKLINLQRLKQFPVEMGKSNLGMVKNLSNLGGDLDIMFNSAYSDEVDARDAKLTSKIHITDLSFNFHHFEVTNDVFEALQAPQSVQLLCIRNFIGKRFLPNWLTSLGNLRELRLFYATEALSIPPLGKLPSLEKLYIMYFSALRSIGREVLGIEYNSNNKQVGVSFPKLLILQLSRCPKLQEWDDIETREANMIRMMPRLESLIIHSCRRLQALPHTLLCNTPSLKNLTITSTNHLLKQSIREDQQLMMHIEEIYLDETLINN